MTDFSDKQSNLKILFRCLKIVLSTVIKIFLGIYSTKIYFEAKIY